MLKDEARERLDEIRMRLRNADAPLKDAAVAKAIGNLIIAIDQISEIVEAMIPDEIVSVQHAAQHRRVASADAAADAVTVR